MPIDTAIASINGYNNYNNKQPYKSKYSNTVLTIGDY